MELIWIDDFLSLERTRNFTRAAKSRNTTQSAYSRRIMRLEEWLGVTLFERDTRPVSLTRQGEEFLTRARRLREDIIDTRRALQAMSSHYSTSTRIYTTNTLAIGFFPQWIKQQEKIGEYSLVVASVRGCLEAVRNGRASMALLPILGNDIDENEWHIKPVAKDALSLYVHKDIPNHVGVIKGKLYGSVLMYSPQTAYGNAVDTMLADKNIELAEKPLCESASAEALAAQVTAGLGGAWLPQSLAENNPNLLRFPKEPVLNVPFEIGLFTAL